jgi:hypothetical protein
MTDETENTRRDMIREQEVCGPLTREQLEEFYGQVWDTAEMTRDFDALGFMAPVVVVRRRSDGVKGSLEFQTIIGHRFYYNFMKA